MLARSVRSLARFARSATATGVRAFSAALEEKEFSPYVTGQAWSDWSARAGVTVAGQVAAPEPGFKVGDEAVKLLKMETRRNPGESEYEQAAGEVIESLAPVFDKDPSLVWVMKSLLEPERAITFRVPWTDDKGRLRVNRGFRIQYSSALGPYKGGLRFHPSVRFGVIRFLGFEQIFKNALTTLPLGAGKGGCDFDPKGKSNAEIMRFCQSFMSELWGHIGPQRDVPAGDIGVGGREVGFLYGQYKRLAKDFSGVLTGKAYDFGGSLIRPEATGYGCVYFAEECIKVQAGEDLKGKKCLVSGAGNVAHFCAEKILDLGGLPCTFSDSKGYIVKEEGFTREEVEKVIQVKVAEPNTRVKEFLDFIPAAVYHEGERPWGVKADYAFPCATQNEVHMADAEIMIKNGVKGVFEGANMPSTNDAISVYKKAGIMFGPGKAANAGGVAVSGLEMAQNAQLTQWTREEVDARLKGIMVSIFNQSDAAAKEYGMPGDIQAGANIAGFLRVARAMIAQGAV
jgi:glutamate dehydrogenase/leucine dehydrogenase